MSDARWSEIEEAVASAVRHFVGAVSIYPKLATAEDRYMATRGLGERPPILTGQAAAAAEETRRFRSIAAHAYDNFDESRAAKAVEGAASLAALLTSEILRFRGVPTPKLNPRNGTTGVSRVPA